MKTHVKSVYGTKTCQPYNALTYYTVNKKVLAREQSFADPLGLGVLDYVMSAGDEGIFVNSLILSAVDMQRNDVFK